MTSCLLSNHDRNSRQNKLNFEFEQKKFSLIETPFNLNDDLPDLTPFLPPASQPTDLKTQVKKMKTDILQ